MELLCQKIHWNNFFTALPKNQKRNYAIFILCRVVETLNYLCILKGQVRSSEKCLSKIIVQKYVLTKVRLSKII